MPGEDKKLTFFIAKVAKNLTVEKCKKKVLISLDEDLTSSLTLKITFYVSFVNEPYLLGTFESFRWFLEGVPLGNQFPLFKVMADAK